MEKITLQNLILKNDIDKNLQDYFELLQRPADLIYNSIEKCHLIEANTHIDFSTYFNCLQVSYWKSHTNVKSFGVAFEFCGDATLEIVSLSRTAKNIDREILCQMPISSGERKKIEIDIPDTEKALVYFSITAHSEFKIYGGEYYGFIEKSDIRDIRIAIATTTFRKEAFIKKNIKILKDKILCEDSPIRDNVFVNVIDNGRTLSPEEIEGYNVKLHSNANVGGAGGYTRGMIEAMRSEFDPTHVLLIDDDVLMVGESLFRTYYLLRTLKDEFVKCFVSGAMFDFDIRETRYEDVGFVNRGNGAYGPIKEPMDMRWIDSLARNEETDCNSGVDTAYAGWWYCCIPVVDIKENGLPLPLFIRGDDVEFSMRNKCGFVTLNGICIWHVGFAGKFNAAMELYQVHRNSFIIQAASGICDGIDFLARIKEFFWKELTRLAYGNAEQLLDSVDDFLKGPEFLKNANGEQIIKEHAAKNEKMLPARQLAPQFEDSVNQPVYEHQGLSKFKKLIYKATLNGHLLPSFMLKRKHGVVAYDWFFSPGSQFLRKTLVAVNPNDKTAAIRRMDRKRAFSLISRYRKLVKSYKKDYAKVAKAYRDQMPEMVSMEFWKNYLNM